MTQGLLRTPTVRVVCDGQSLNRHPVAPNAYPDLLMANHPKAPWHPYLDNASVGGASWTTLSTTVGTRLNPRLGRATYTGLVLCGGTTDIATDASTAQQTYDRMVTYANNARTAGFSWVIATTITGGYVFDAGEDAIRLSCNTLIKADASAGFNGVADIDAAMPDYNNATYYVDLLHWTAAGASLAASTVQAVMATMPGFA